MFSQTEISVFGIRTTTLKCKWAATWQNQQSECAPSEDSDQPGHPPSLIRVFAVRMKKPWVLSYQLSTQRRLWSDWANAQADLSLRWAHTHFVGFVMLWLKCCFSWQYAQSRFCRTDTCTWMHGLTHVTNGLSHPYHLDESIFNFRGIRSNFSFLFHFSLKFL